MGGDRERAGGPDLPVKIISCHLFPRRKTGTNLPREAIRPPPPILYVYGLALKNGYN